MKPSFSLCLLFPLAFYAGCRQSNSISISTSIIAEGQMPNLVKDNMNNLHLVYGYGDSIMYAFSADHGKSFSEPALVAILPELVAKAMRGPQIASSGKTLTILAANKSGNIYSYRKDESGHWINTAGVNDVDSVAKEGFMAVSGDGNNLFAVWLDLRGNKHNKIVGAKSTDGGITWSKNILIYGSPDSTVCECCKPSVAVKGNTIVVMFRNWLHGNRDMYLIQSNDGGNSFGNAQKLGDGSWALNGCPMDGGGLTINTRNQVETVWNRKGKIYACEPGKPEIEIGTGRNCTIESANGNLFAWTENGEIIIRMLEGTQKKLGRGQLPLIKNINDEQVVCIWENDKQIHAAWIDHL